MEALLHYVWKHKMLPPGQIETTIHQPVEVIDPGLHNMHAGPDFFNAKVKVDGTLWVGNVEIHERASDWYAHGHDSDPAYDNVVLHVCEEADTEVKTHSGHILPQMEVSVPAHVAAHYQELLSTDRYPPCYTIIPTLPRLMVHAWMSALQVERLEQKTNAIAQRVALCDGSWEAACFVTLARNYGFGVNGDAFELWARSIPMHAADHHRDDIFQVEALFMGQAGLLDPQAVPERYREAAVAEGYFTRLRNEYLYLRHKFGLTPIDYKLWKFLRMRPQNFPHIRIAQLARLYCARTASLSQLMECRDAKEVGKALSTSVTPYWETHYVFGSESERKAKKVSAATKRLLLINTVIPMMFAYGRHRGDEKLADRAFDLLEQVNAEDNNIVRLWQECGLDVESAGDSQALIQLKKEYCDRRDCLRCRIGHEYMKRK